jgi:hypothetical protein
MSAAEEPSEDTAHIDAQPRKIKLLRLATDKGACKKRLKRSG